MYLKSIPLLLFIICLMFNLFIFYCNLEAIELVIEHYSISSSYEYIFILLMICTDISNLICVCSIWSVLDSYELELHKLLLYGFKNEES